MRALIPVLAAAMALIGCGYMANPRPPLANVPGAIQSMTVEQRGAVILVDFPVPDRTTEDRPIPMPRKLDFRIGTYGTPFNAEGWAAQATKVAPAKIGPDSAHFEIPAADWIGKEAILSARIIGGNGKASHWSNFAVVPVVPAPEKPEGVRAENTPQGVRLSWTARGASFRVFRRMGEEAAFKAMGNSEKPEWLDTSAEIGKQYVYRVQTIAKAGTEREATSDPSAEIAITPKDEFPPAVPLGLRAIAALQTIELNWEPNTEAFLGGYRIYRATGSGAFEKLADAGMTPTYSDHAVEARKTYRYAVTAVSKAGNESPRSEAAEAGLP